MFRIYVQVTSTTALNTNLQVWALSRSKKFLDFNIVVFLFIFNNYYLIKLKRFISLQLVFIFIYI